MHIEVVLSPNMKWLELFFLISLLHWICPHHILKISTSSTSEGLAGYEKKIQEWFTVADLATELSFKFQL